MKLLSPDGGDEASNTKRSTANNSDSTTSMDRNAVNMTMENSQLKKQLAVVGWTPKISDRKKKEQQIFFVETENRQSFNICRYFILGPTVTTFRKFTYFFRTLI